MTNDRFMSSGKPWTPSGAPPVAVLMSGGVDSSVTAAMLKRQGFDVVGFTLQIPSGIQPACCGGAELRACCGTGASEVARQLGVPHYFLDVRDEFRSMVIEPFRLAYRNGRTPSPCIDCNTHIKFGVALRRVREAFGIDHVATGHYARVDASRLYAASDTAKDQSYFLYGIRRGDLARILFPVGDQPKTETRRLAAELGLDVADREESLELCFADQGDYRAALGPDPDAGPGDIVDAAGRVLGRHKGVSHYTIGQREGLGIAARTPLYVTKIDPTRNIVVLGDRAAAAGTTVHARNLNIISPDLLGGPLLAKIRSRQPAAPCRLRHIDATSLVIDFDKPQHAITPGQHLVLYSPAGQVIGGGEIGEAAANNA